MPEKKGPRKEVGGMAAQPKELRLIRKARQEDPGPHRQQGEDVVAVVLADGSLRRVDGRPVERSGNDGFVTGQLNGDGWILWWERRGFAREPRRPRRHLRSV